MNRINKGIFSFVLSAFLLISSIFVINADTTGPYSMNIGGTTDVIAVAGDQFNVNVTVESEENDIYEVRIPKDIFTLVNFDSTIFERVDDTSFITLRADLGRPELHDRVNNTSFIIKSNHEEIPDGFTTRISARIIELNSTVIEKGGIDFEFSNPTVYDVQKIERILPDPLTGDVVIGELVTYELNVGSTSPHTTLKQAIVTIPVPAGFELGPNEPGTLNSLFTQPNGAGTDLISLSRDISGSWTGNITGKYTTGVPGNVVAAQSPNIKGEIVGIAQDRTSPISAMNDIIGEEYVRLLTDLKPYAMTETLLIDSTQHNYENKLFSFFVWNESNVTLENVQSTFTVADGYAITGIRTPMQSYVISGKVINRFDADTTFTFITKDVNDNVLETSNPIGADLVWTPSTTDRIHSVSVVISKLRPGDGTNTLTSGQNAHYHAYNYGANAGFLVMGEGISEYSNGSPVQEGDILEVNAKVDDYVGVRPSNVSLGTRKLNQKATLIKEYMSITEYTASSNYLQRNQDLSINFNTSSMTDRTRWIYSNFPGVEGPVFYVVTPHNTQFKGDVENQDLSEALEGKNGFGSPDVSYVKTLDDGRQVIKIAYSDDPTSAQYNEVIGNRLNDTVDIKKDINFAIHLKVSDDVMYGTQTAIWGDGTNGILFYEDNQRASYEDVQSRIPDQLDLDGDQSSTDYLVANGYLLGNQRNHTLYNNRTPLTFIGPNQLSGDNANRNNLEDYKRFNVSRSLETAAVFTQDTTLEGSYRTNLFNGLDGDVTGIVQYLPLPQRETSSMSVSLTGPVNAPADTTVLYSKELVDIQQGAAINESTFTDGSELNGDYSEVKSIIFKVARLSKYQNKLIEVPITITNPKEAIVGEPAIVNTYITAENSLDNSLLFLEGSDDLATVYLAQDAELTIRKVDETDQTLGLANAVFKLEGPNNFETQITTNSSGEVTIPNLEFGNYVLTEVVAPSGYKLLEAPITFEVNQEVQTLVVANTIEPTRSDIGTIRIVKVDTDDTNIVLANAQFELRSSDGDVWTKTTDENGIIEFGSLPYGTYTLKELNAPLGYELLNDSIQIVLSSSLNEIVVENMKQSTPTTTGQLIITKVDSNDKTKVLSGAEFEVSGPNGFIRVETTDLSGRLILSDLEPGNYTIKETKAPDGYTLDEQLYTALIEVDNVTELTITNKVNDPKTLPHTGVQSPILGASLLIGLGLIILIVSSKRKLRYTK